MLFQIVCIIFIYFFHLFTPFFSEDTSFNHSVDYLPSALCTLKIFSYFFCPLDNLPSSLKHLSVSSKSKYPFHLDNLPFSLCELKLTFHLLDYPLVHLPPSLTNFVFSQTVYSYSHPLKLPPFLSTCSVNAPFENHSLPKTIIKFEALSTLLVDLPLHLTHLHLIRFNLEHPLPPSLQYLELSYATKPLSNLPPITTLILGCLFNYTVPLLEMLHLANFPTFNLPVDDLPPSLTLLQLGDSFSHPVNNLPSSLRTLVIGDSFDHPINNLPSSVTDLSLGNSFNHPVGCLPIIILFQFDSFAVFFYF